MPSKYGFETDDDRKKADDDRKVYYAERDKKVMEREQQKRSLATRIYPVVQEIIGDYLASRYSVIPKLEFNKHVTAWRALIADKVVGKHRGHRDFGQGLVEVTWDIFETYSLLVQLCCEHDSPEPDFNLTVSLEIYRKMAAGPGEFVDPEPLQDLVDVLRKKTGMPTKQIGSRQGGFLAT